MARCVVTFLKMRDTLPDDRKAEMIKNKRSRYSILAQIAAEGRCSSLVGYRRNHISSNTNIVSDAKINIKIHRYGMYFLRSCKA